MGKIEVYIRNQKVSIPDEYVRPVVDHGCTDGQHFRIQRSMSESDKQTLNCVQEFADNKGLTLDVCDTGTFRGKIKAWIKGVKTTPTVIMGNSKVQGDLTAEELSNKLQSCTTG